MREKEHRFVITQVTSTESKRSQATYQYTENKNYLIYMRSRRRQNILSKLGAWGRCERVKGEARRKDRRGEKFITQLKKKKHKIKEIIKKGKKRICTGQ